MINSLFFENPELEDLGSDLSELAYLSMLARNVVKLLLIGKYNNLSLLAKTIFNRKFLSGIFWEKNAAALFLMRQEMRNALVRFFEQVGSLEEQPELYEKLQLNLANALLLYVMFEPTPHDGVIKIPRRIDGQYQLVDYAITPIELTASPELLSSVEDKDRVFGYGFTPLNNEKANRILILMGTTFPTGQGLKLQNRANFYPQSNVGELYNWENVLNWVNASHDPQGLDVGGISQGGSVSLLLALMCPEKIRRVDALNPLGLLHDYDEDHPVFGAWEKTKKSNPKKLPEVVIQRQSGDPVSPFGFWKDGWKILNIHLNDNKFMFPVLYNYYAHLGNYLGQTSASITETSGIAENTKARYYRTTYFFPVVRNIFYYGSKIMDYFSAKGSQPSELAEAKIHEKQYYEKIMDELKALDPKQKGLFWMKKEESVSKLPSEPHQITDDRVGLSNVKT